MNGPAVEKLFERGSEIEIGDTVQVTGGPLDGLRGMLVKVDGEIAVLDLGKTLGVSLTLSVKRIAAAD